MILFGFSIYGGYFSAGAGITILATLQILSFRNYHLANRLKNLLVTALALCGIVIYGTSDAIAWPEALTMMLGSAAGGYCGGRLGRKINAEALRAVVIAFGFLLSGYYFYSYA